MKDCLNRKDTVLAVSADSKSAYDFVWRLKLLHKMQKLGIKNKMLNWFYNLFSLLSDLL